MASLQSIRPSSAIFPHYLSRSLHNVYADSIGSTPRSVLKPGSREGGILRQAFSINTFEQRFPNSYEFRQYSYPVLKAVIPSFSYKRRSVSPLRRRDGDKIARTDKARASRLTRLLLVFTAYMIP